MKKLILLLFLIPNLVMAESYLCITENATGLQYNLNNKSYSSATFKDGQKYIVKKIAGEWKAIIFGSKEDSLINSMTKCSSLIDEEGIVLPKGALAEITCEKFSGYFSISINRMRFINVTYGSYLKPDKKGQFYADPAIEIGSCSSI